MHLQFYHLTRPPFQLATDLDFFWKGKNYDPSFDVLKYSLEHHGGLSLLTGAAGSGKSMVVRALLNALGNSVRAAVIPDSSLTSKEFYDLVAHEFDLAAGIENRRVFHDHIHVLLQEAGKNNQQVLLVVDEAQQLSPQLIDEISALINLEPVDSGGLGICLVGQSDTAQDLGARVSQAFENHVIVRYHLASFTADEIEKYIQHRLEVAGADRRIFSDDAILEIHRSSGGYPGQINIICDLALFTGYTENAAEIGPAIIQTSAAKLQFPGMQETLGDTCPAVTPADLETEDKNLVQEEKNEAGPTAEDVAGAAVAAEAGGRSFALPALAVLMALVFAGGGYALYTKRADTQSLALPAVIDPPPIVDTTASPAQKTGKEPSDFDAVGYSPPGEENFFGEQSVKGETPPVAALDTELVPAGDSAAENIEEVAEETIPVSSESAPDRLEVQALQVEESLSATPAAEEAATPKPNDIVTPPQQESVTAAVSKEAVAGTETVVKEEVVEVSPAAESVVEPAREQQQAMDVDTSPAETERRMEKNTDVPPARTGKPELEQFFEAGAFVSPSSSSPQVIKTSQRARTVGTSPKKEIKIKIEPTPQPDPEDLIDWLLKKKEQHAQ